MGAAPTTNSSSALESVLNLYLNIQSALARDSMKNVSTNAEVIAALVRSDKTKSIPSSIGEQAWTLAKAKHIGRARAAFKILSQSLIVRLRADPAPPGVYYEFYCPVVKASWLQGSETAMNPYLGWRAETPTWGWACPAVEEAQFGRARIKVGK